MNKYEVAIREIINVLAPGRGCSDIGCDGCEADIAEAYRIAVEVINRPE